MGSCLHSILWVGELLPLSARDSNPPMHLSDLATDSHVNTLFSMTVRKLKTDSFGRGCEVKLA